MKKNEFLKELDSRLDENKKLNENPGMGARVSGVSSFVGLHAFWIILGISLLITVVFYSYTDKFNNILFGFLYE